MVLIRSLRTEHIISSSGPIALCGRAGARNQVLGKWKFLQEKLTFLSPQPFQHDLR